LFAVHSCRNILHDYTASLQSMPDLQMWGCKSQRYGGPQVSTSRKPTTQQFSVVVLWVFWTLTLLGHRSLRYVVGTSTTQQFHLVVLPKNPQYNNLKLLCCGFSGRWHLWATVQRAGSHLFRTRPQTFLFLLSAVY